MGINGACKIRDLTTVKKRIAFKFVVFFFFECDYICACIVWLGTERNSFWLPQTKWNGTFATIICHNQSTVAATPDDSRHSTCVDTVRTLATYRLAASDKRIPHYIVEYGVRTVSSEHLLSGCNFWLKYQTSIRPTRVRLTRKFFGKQTTNWSTANRWKTLPFSQFCLHRIHTFYVYGGPPVRMRARDCARVFLLNKHINYDRDLWNVFGYHLDWSTACRNRWMGVGKLACTRDRFVWCRIWCERRLGSRKINSYIWFLGW